MTLKTIQLLLIILLTFSINNAQNVEITNSIVVGGVTSSSARFWIRTSKPSQVNIELSESNIFANSTFGTSIETTLEKGNAEIIEVDGLNAATKYYYRAISDNNLNDNLERYFWTFPENGTVSTFSFAFGSCQQSGNFLPSDSDTISVFNEIINHEIKFFLQLGDWGYPDTTDLIPQNNNFFAANYELVQETYWSRFNKDYPMDTLFRKMPVDYVYDDHDYMNNNSSALTSSYYIPYKPNDLSNDFVTMEIDNPIGARENSIKGYKENMPGYNLENESRGIYHKFTHGNVEVFALDLRSQKSSALNSITINSTTNLWEFNPPEGHTIIGREQAVGEGESQLSWFLNSLKESTADWKFIMSSVPFNIGQVAALKAGLLLQNVVIPIEGAPDGTTAIAASFELADGWSGFPNDTETILNFIDANEIKNVIVLSGDSHNSAIDDGTNAGLPEIMAGNLDITNSKSITLFESFGINIWNKGGHGISTDEFNDAFGKVTVYGSDSVNLSLIDEFGTLFAEHTVLSKIATSVDDQKINHEFNLVQNYPNPFNPITTIKYIIPNVATQHAVSSPNVNLIIYNVLGKKVSTLVNERQKSGNQEVQFDASSLTSGVYFYKLSVGKYVQTRKMILLK